MMRAIDLAQKSARTHPNPRVGSVVIDRESAVVGEGWHRGPGADHAEIVALDEAGASAQGATVYVTLEPCSHHGRTPPCVDALIAAGVSTVVVGAIDPDPRVAGEGARKLRDAGIEVITGVHEEEARRVDPAYFHHREKGTPLVTIKWAMTMDGSVAASDGTSQWITGDLAREHAHTLRSQVDGVVVGAGTVRADDPSLDVRLDGYQGPQPRPIVIAGRTPLPDHARIWDREPLVVSSAPREIPSGELVEVAGDENRPDPVETCRMLGERGLLHLLVEGGPRVARAWWRAGVVSNGVVYIGSIVGGGTGKSAMAGVFANIDDAVEVECTTVAGVGNDVVIEFERRS